MREKSEEQVTLSTYRSERILLVVHDLVYGLKLVTALLQKTAYEVFLATERYQAMEFLQEGIPCLMIIDYHLPGMNGLELADLLHQQAAFATLPIILLTPGDPRLDEQLRQRKLEGLRKPCSPDELIACIQQVLT